MTIDQYKKKINAWVMYDWANSAFATTVMAGFMPVYFVGLAEVAGLTGQQATSAWGYVVTVALVIVAVLAPGMGYMADRMGGKKKFLSIFAVLGAIGSMFLYIPVNDQYRLAGVIYIVANIGFAGANIFYNALLPHIATDDDLDRVSSQGYAMGYLGGGLLLVINVLMAMQPSWFGIPDASLAVRMAFVSVGIWWLIFTIPLWRHIEEPPTPTIQTLGFADAFRAGFKEMAATFKKIQMFPEAFKLLLAFWLYNDGIGTIMKMATAYGSEIGIDPTMMVGALALVQFVGIPFTLLFGRLPKRFGTRNSILLGLGIYAIISVGGYFMSEAWHFWVLAFMVGLVQGGTQALSRSLFGAMIPRERSGEFFGFYSMSDKFAGIVGPLTFAWVGTLTGSSRWGIASLIIFFLLGGILLMRVDSEKGIRDVKDARII